MAVILFRPQYVNHVRVDENKANRSDLIVFCTFPSYLLQLSIWEEIPSEANK